jgi:hypothetical protein
MTRPDRTCLPSTNQTDVRAHTQRVVTAHMHGMHILNSVILLRVRT